MKKSIIYIAFAAATLFFACQDSRQNNSASDTQTETEADTTYLENQDNNGQPTTDHDGGTVNETKGAPESGYGNSNNTEQQPSNTGSSGSAAGRGAEIEK